METEGSRTYIEFSVDNVETDTLLPHTGEYHDVHSFPFVCDIKYSIISHGTLLSAFE